MVDVLFTPSRIHTRGIAVVIDVLRATSTIVTALANGALCVKPVVNLARARMEKSKNTLICGERNGVKPKGFDLGNSPLEYTSDAVFGKNLVLTTTNGTKAVHLVKSPRVLAGSFLNLSAVVVQLKHSEEILVVCSGQDRFIAMEDVLCAGALIERLDRDDLGDGAKIAFQLWKGLKTSDLQQMLLDTLHGKELAKKGFAEDIVFCSQIDRFHLVPELVENRFVV